MTGQTFWERPLYEDEVEHPLKGGNRLDDTHAEPPSTMTKGQEGLAPRLHQGEFRKFQGTHHETDGDAKKRRKQVAALAPLARDRGEIPGIEPYVPTDTTNNDLYGDGADGDRVPAATAAAAAAGGRATGPPAPSTLDSLSAYTVDTAHGGQRGSDGVLRLSEQDITRTPGGPLLWPPAGEGVADINEVPPARPYIRPYLRLLSSPLCDPLSR